VRRVRLTTIFVQKQLVLNVVCVCILALVNQYKNPTFSVPYYIVIFDLGGYAIFFYAVSYAARFSGWGITKRKICVVIFFTFVWNISLYQKNWARYYRNWP